MNRPVWIGLAVSLALGMTFGCGTGDSRPSAEIQGVVQFDGQPLEEGSVHFSSTKSGETAYANLGPGGAYTVTFDEVDAGQVYEVAVTKPVNEELDAHAFEASQQAPTVSIPPKYTNRATSGLSLTVQGGTQTYDINLEK